MQSNDTKECAKLTRKELPQKLITLADLDQGAEETKNPVVMGGNGSSEKNTLCPYRDGKRYDPSCESLVQWSSSRNNRAPGHRV